MKILYTENGKPSGTKALLSLAGLVVIFRLAAGAFGAPELDLAGAGALIAAFGAVYGGRRATEAWSARAGKAFKPSADASGGEHGGNAP